MKKTTSGFTIVELMIVISVIAILATISIVSYNGVQERARNASRLVAGQQWVDVFELYQGQFGAYPPQLYPPGPGFCLGTGFPIGSGGVPKCKAYTSGNSYVTPSPRGSQPEAIAESTNTAFLNELRRAGDLPQGAPVPTVSKMHVGPFIDYNRYTLAPAVAISIDGIVAFGNDCGGGFISDYVDNTNKLTVCLFTLR